MTYRSDCTERQSPLDDPGVQALALQRGLELEKMLARSTGEFTSMIRWPAPGHNVIAAPESGDVPVKVRVNYQGGEATYVEAGGEGYPPGTEVSGCPARIQANVSVELLTEGGALNEQFSAVLAMEQHIGKIHYRARLDSLDGSLSLSAPPPAGRTQIVLGSELDVFMQVSDAGTSGRLSVIVLEFTDGIDTTSIPADGSALTKFASWPAEEVCSPNQIVAPIDSSFAEVSPARVLELVAAVQTPFVWGDGTESTLTLSATPSSGAACAQDDEDVVHFWLDAEALAATVDGSLDGPVSGPVHLVRWPDRVAAIFNLGGSVSREQLIELLPAAAASRYDGGYVDFDVTHHFAWPSGELIGSEGQLSVMVTSPDCNSGECDGFPLVEGRIPDEAAPPAR